MKSTAIGCLGSARASRAGGGASPPRTLIGTGAAAEKFAMARAPSPAREARALPRVQTGAIDI